MISAPRQERMLFGDEADAHAFWKDKEWKTYAVDLIEHQGKKQKLIHIGKYPATPEPRPKKLGPRT